MEGRGLYLFGAYYNSSLGYCSNEVSRLFQMGYIIAKNLSDKYCIYLTSVGKNMPPYLLTDQLKMEGYLPPPLPKKKTKMKR